MGNEVRADTNPENPNDSQAFSRESGQRRDLEVEGVSVYTLPIFTDKRGSLSVGELGNGLPFQPRRFFVVFDVPPNEVRGEHAHRQVHQFLVCIKGSCSLRVDDSRLQAEIVLDSPSIGVHLSPLVWASQYKFSPDAVLLVLASALYDPASYIRDYREFARIKAEKQVT